LRLGTHGLSLDARRVRVSGCSAELGFERGRLLKSSVEL